jgi:hypothetical protein
MGEETKKQPSAATLMYRLAAERKIELFHTADRKAYAVVPMKEHKEVWPLDSNDFKTWLADEFMEEYERTARNGDIKDVVNSLTGRARKIGQEKKVYLRAAKDKKTICIFLADKHWRHVCICSGDWFVTDKSPVYFIKGSGMKALPEPKKGGTVDLLRRYLNLASDRDWHLYLAWLTSCFRPTGPYPVLVVTGPQGSAKSSFMRLTRSCIDPNIAPVRQEPKSIQDVVVDATHSWIVAYDNLSKLDQAMSDCLCCLATGSGYAARTLFKDSDLTILEAQRPCMIGSIEEIVSKGDLLSRSLFVRLEEIPPDKRLTESSFIRPLTKTCR